MMGILLGLGISVVASAAPGDVLWSRTYGGSGQDFGICVQQTNDGGYIVGGGTYSYGSASQFYLVKTDANGNSQWSQNYGGSDVDWGQSVQQTTDGGYIIGGVTTSYGAGFDDFYLIKTDANGNSSWARTYGGVSNEYAYSVRQTSDGGYIVTGYTWSYGAGQADVYLVKTDVNGNALWTQTYGGSGFDAGFEVRQTSDGGYIVAGWTTSYGAGGYDLYLVKTNSSGAVSWSRTYGGYDNDRAYSVEQTSDGGYIVAGGTSSYGAGNSDFYLVKTNASGNALWTRTFGGSNAECAYSVQQTIAGGYIIAGHTNSYGAGNNDCYLVRTDGSGNKLWVRTYGGSYEEQASSIRQTTDGGYIFAGWTESYGAGSDDVYLVKIDREDYDIEMVPDSSPVVVPAGGSFGLTGIIGNPCDSYIGTIDVWYGVQAFGNYYQQGRYRNLGPFPPYAYYSAHLNQRVPRYAPPGAYVYKAWCGTYPFINVQDSAWFTFTITTINGDAGEWNCEGNWGVEPPDSYAMTAAYPNPFNAMTTITFELPEAGNVTLEIFNVAGQKVDVLANGSHEAGRHNVVWNASKYPSGVYFYRLVIGDNAFTGRMTLLK